jgi:hypothetical protein
MRNRKLLVAWVLSATIGAWTPAQTKPSELTNEQAQKLLAAPLPEISMGGIGLAQAFQQFEHVSGVSIITDWSDLAALGITTESPVTLRIGPASGDKLLKAIIAIDGNGIAA